MNLGFIGLGTMGLPMAANLLRAGHKLRVWNRSSIDITQLTDLGAELVASPAQAGQADVLISMLADDAATAAVVLDDGVLATMPPGSIHVNMATVSVSFAQKLASLHESAGVGYVAAPVLGRVDVAQAGNLQILAGGRADLLARVQPLFDALGQKTWHFGEEPAQANVVKLAANFMIASAIETMGEASALVGGHGISKTDFLNMVTSTLFAAPVYQGYGQRIGSGQYEPAGFKLALGLKDVRLALEAADAVSVPLPFASVLKDNLLDNLAHGQGLLDWAALADVASRRAGQT